MIKRKTTAEESDILKEIKRNTTREKEVIQAMKKEDGLTWEENRVVYIEGRIYVPNLNASRIKSNIKRRQENYIHWRYLKDHSKKSVSISLDLY